MQTFDSALRTDASGNMMGKALGQRCVTHDGKTVDSTGAFLIGELERLDPTLHEPLAAVTWARDIDLREDVSIADDVSSFSLQSYASAGGAGTGNGVGNGKAWIGKDTTQITGVSVDNAKIPHPLRPWGIELKYTILELESAARLGRPIDVQKYDGMKLKHSMDIDEQVYIGDLTTGDPGILTSSLVTPQNFPAGAGGTVPWASKTPNEILADINSVIIDTWTQSAYSVMPNRLLVPPKILGYLASVQVGTAGNNSILKFVLENNILTTNGSGKQLEILSTKWNVGAGVGGTIGVSNGKDRLMAYSKEKQFLRYPMTLLQRTPIQYDSIYQKTTYFCKLGVVEIVYPETVAYRDGL